MLWTCLPAAKSSAWVRMFSILASSRVPYFWASFRALPGMLVWTWTLKASSSSPITRLSPMLLRYVRSGSSEISAMALRTMNTVSKAKVMSSAAMVAKSAFSSLDSPASVSGMGSPRSSASMPSRIRR